MPASSLKMNPTAFSPLPPVDITIVKGSATIVSNFAGAYTHVQDELRTPWSASGWGTSDPTAVANARAWLATAMGVLNQHIKGWGPGDPWPTPSAPNAAYAGPVWNAGLSGGPAADARLNTWDAYCQVIADIAAVGGGLLMVTLCQAPYWMYGMRNNGTDSVTGTDTQLISDANSDFSSHTTSSIITRTDRHAVDGVNYVFPSGYVNPDYSKCRVLDDQMTNWKTLCYHMAKRAMAKFGVRWFQVWNEYKGYFHGSGSGISPVSSMNGDNTWDSAYNNSGNTSGPHATHGYVYMYNQVEPMIRQAATELGISAQVKVGGSYISHELRDSSGVGGFVCSVSGFSGNHAYGYHSDRTIQPLLHWLQHKTSADFICLRASVKCNDISPGTPTGGLPRPFATNDPFAQQALYADLHAGVRGLSNTTYPGAATLPMVVSEWYSPQNPADNNTDLQGAISASAHIKWIKAGGWAMLRWGGSPSTDEICLWYPNTNVAGGGIANQTGTALAILHQHFGAGTQLYTPIISGTNAAYIEAIMSGSQVYVRNHHPTATLAVDTGSAYSGVISVPPYSGRLG